MRLVARSIIVLFPFYLSDCCFEFTSLTNTALFAMNYFGRLGIPALLPYILR